MLLSMTGFGEAHQHGPACAVSVEIRSVNNRHLKLTVRGTEPYPLMESELEKIVRRTVRRGSLLMHIRVERAATASTARLNENLLIAYFESLRSACRGAGVSEHFGTIAAGVLNLPGIAPEQATVGAPPEEEWPVVEAAILKALTKLDEVRGAEGQAMADELLLYHRQMGEELQRIKEQMPRVMADYRQRILERIRQAVSDTGVVIEPEHLVREVAVFADRTDVAEEVTRFGAHLDQFASVVRSGSEGAGRRLEFIVQEMGREANTMGSKAGDVTVSRYVVEIKATLEKVRELIQNVE